MKAHAHTAETSNPLLPNIRFSIFFPLANFTDPLPVYPAM